MSGFFGIFNPKGTGIDLDAFDQMKKAADRPGHDGIETYVDDHIALGHVMLRVSPESQHDQQPLKSSCGNYILAGHFRLDYRDELGDKLGLTQLELENTSDSLLVMMAFQKWNEKCVDHLEGDWTFAVYNYKTKGLKIFRDKLGISALFYQREGQALYFSSDFWILTIPQKIRQTINEKRVLSFFLENSTINNQTFYEELFILRNGEKISIYNDQIKIEKYSNFFSTKITDKYLRYEDYVFEFETIFSQAVKSRINPLKKNGIYLSGGKDSTAVAFFLAKELELRNQELFTYTNSPLYSSTIIKYDQKIVNENLFVEDFLQLIPNAKAKFINFKELDLNSVFNSTLSLNPFMPVITKNTYWLNGILEIAKSDGVSTIFTGQLGNSTISYNGFYYYADLLKSFRFRELLCEILREYKNSRKEFLKNIKIQILIPLIQLIKFSFSPTFKFKKNWNFSLLRSKYIFLYFKIFYTKIFRRAFRFFTLELNKRIEYTAYLSSSCSIMWFSRANYYYTHVSDPTGDIRLVNFTNNISGNLFYRNGISKYLYRRLMKNRIPDSIFKNDSYQSQSFDFIERFKMHHFSDESSSEFYSLTSITNKFISIEKARNCLKLILKGGYDRETDIRLLKFLDFLSMLNFEKSKKF